jgi:hypothetical protein
MATTVGYKNFLAIVTTCPILGMCIDDRQPAAK